MSLTFPQQALKSSLWETTSTSVLKWHTGATQALTGVRESCFVCLKIEFVHYYRFSSVFGLLHKAKVSDDEKNNCKIVRIRNGF